MSQIIIITNNILCKILICNMAPWACSYLPKQPVTRILYLLYLTIYLFLKNVDIWTGIAGKNGNRRTQKVVSLRNALQIFIPKIPLERAGKRGGSSENGSGRLWKRNGTWFPKLTPAPFWKERRGLPRVRVCRLGPQVQPPASVTYPVCPTRRNKWRRIK